LEVTGGKFAGATNACVWGIEAGGTKRVCAIGSGPDDIRAMTRFPTTAPDETLRHAINFFRAHSEELTALGIASFGPVDLQPASPTWGHVTTTPKPGWAISSCRTTAPPIHSLVCLFHGDCLEGLASGPAIEARWSRPAATLPPDHPAWPLQARYLALALVNFICTLSPQRIILGGGVMQQPQLFPFVRVQVQHLLNGYVSAPEIVEQIDGYIVPPALGSRAGVLGALALAAKWT
jgi:predicted NBD/HSP70 family sugar kinase